MSVYLYQLVRESDICRLLWKVTYQIIFKLLYKGNSKVYQI